MSEQATGAESANSDAPNLGEISAALEAELNDGNAAEPEPGVIPEPEPDPEPDPEPVDDEPHGEKSRLGRKVKRLEGIIETVNQTNVELQTTLKALVETLQRGGTQPQPGEIDEIPEFATNEELVAYIDKRAAKIVEKTLTGREAQAQAKEKEYSDNYLRLLTKAVEHPEDEEDEQAEIIYELMTKPDSPYNVKHTGDASQDFIINYRAATKHLLTKGQEKKPNLHNKKPDVPTGVTVPSTAPKVIVFDRSKLSPAEQELAKGFKDEELAKMFG